MTAFKTNDNNDRDSLTKIWYDNDRGGYDWSSNDIENHTNYIGIKGRNWNWRMDEQIDGKIDEQMNWYLGYAYGRTDGWMDGLHKEQIE